MVHSSKVRLVTVLALLAAPACKPREPRLNTAKATDLATTDDVPVTLTVTDAKDDADSQALFIDLRATLSAYLDLPGGGGNQLVRRDAAGTIAVNDRQTPPRLIECVATACTITLPGRLTPKGGRDSFAGILFRGLSRRLGVEGQAQLAPGATLVIGSPTGPHFECADNASTDPSAAYQCAFQAGDGAPAPDNAPTEEKTPKSPEKPAAPRGFRCALAKLATDAVFGADLVPEKGHDMVEFIEEARGPATLLVGAATFRAGNGCDFKVEGAGSKVDLSVSCGRLAIDVRRDGPTATLRARNEGRGQLLDVATLGRCAETPPSPNSPN